MSLSVFFLVLFAAFLHASWNFAAKRAAGNPRVLWVGIAMGVLLMCPVVMARISLADLSALAIVCMLASGALYAFYFYGIARSFALGELSVMYPIFRGTGVCVGTVLAALCFNDELSRLGGVGVCCTALGLFAIAVSGNASTLSKQSLGYALSCGVAIAAYVNVDGIAVHATDPVVYLFGTHLIALLLLFFPIVFRQFQDCVRIIRTDKVSAGLIGIGSMGTYLIILYAFRLAPVSYVISLRECSVIFASLMGMYFLSETVSKGKVVGILLVLVGMISIRLA